MMRAETETVCWENGKRAVKMSQECSKTRLGESFPAEEREIVEKILLQMTRSLKSMRDHVICGSLKLKLFLFSLPMEFKVGQRELQQTPKS